MENEKRKEQKRKASLTFKEKNPNYNSEYHKKKLNENPDYNKEKRDKIKDSESYKKSHLRRNKNWNKKFPEKRKAHMLVQRRIKIKGLCQRCKINPAKHRHHPDYSKPLEVIWLCQAHHSEIHRQLNSK